MSSGPLIGRTHVEEWNQHVGPLPGAWFACRYAEPTVVEREWWSIGGVQAPPVRGSLKPMAPCPPGLPGSCTARTHGQGGGLTLTTGSTTGAAAVERSMSLHRHRMDLTRELAGSSLQGSVRSRRAVFRINTCGRTACGRSIACNVCAGSGIRRGADRVCYSELRQGRWPRQTAGSSLVTKHVCSGLPRYRTVSRGPRPLPGSERPRSAAIGEVGDGGGRQSIVARRAASHA